MIDKIKTRNIFKFKAKMISQYATSNMPTFASQSYQHQKLEKFVQSTFYTLPSRGVIERTRPAKRRPRPVPEEKKDEVLIKTISLYKNIF